VALGQVALQVRQFIFGQYQSTIIPPEINYDEMDTGEVWNLNSEAILLRQSGSVKK